MKKLTKIITAAALSFAVLGAAHAGTELVPADNEAGSKLCITATTGNVFKMHKALGAFDLCSTYINQPTLVATS